MRRLVAAWVFASFVSAACSFSLFAVDSKVAEDNATHQETSSFITRLKADQLRENLREVNRFLKDPNNVWMTRYENFREYLDLVSEIKVANQQLAALKRLAKTRANQSEIAALEKKIGTLERQREILEGYKSDPFQDLVQPAEIGDAPTVSNPLLIVQALSYMQHARSEVDALERNHALLGSVIEKLQEREAILFELGDFDITDAEKAQYLDTQKAIQEFESTQNIFVTTLALYRKKVDDQIAGLSLQIKAQVTKLIYIGVTLILFFIIALTMKAGIRKYIHDNERIYTANKIINFVNISLVILVLLFAYLENVTYLVTVLGFASAGLAIAMKDLFMSVLGWLVIVIGGSLSVGDRIRILKDGTIYVGDILDISILRITLHEDITMISYREHHRAGRIIFIPNNYIFTTMIANYTHGTMKTVWDEIVFTVTFDSNYHKVMSIAREITKRYSKGYTEITRQQLNALRDRYSLRSANVEPRVFSMLEPNGIRISIWYQTNSYATLTLRSTISGEIIEAVMMEKDIELAYPTTTLRPAHQPFNPPHGKSAPPPQGDPVV